MSQPLPQNPPEPSVNPIGKSAKEKIRNTLTDELIIGICAPIGSSRIMVIQTITKMLTQDYEYDVRILKLSDYINEYNPVNEPAKSGETHAYTELLNKIKGGDQIREKYGPSVLAEIAINNIHYSRHIGDAGNYKYKPVEQLTSRRVCFIIDSLKNKEELELFREVYKDLFYFFSVFSPRHEREKNLSDKNLSNSEVDKIIETDNFENDSHGQNVKDTFVAADFFVRVSKENMDTLEDRISRYLHMIFENEIITPYPNETAMYEAQSVAGNSACLSRQVGAAITDIKGEIISRGWNDVPKYGGNLYQEGNEPDARCKHNGYCSNDRTKDVIADGILKAVLTDGYLIENLFDKKRIEESSDLYLRIKQVIRKNTRIRDLIEFSRSVHAEMHAIITGSQLSASKMIGGKLFCTTYPCHNCARHIIVAGIREIYYIEPYSKSLSLALHSDAITENETESNKVKLLVYDGVAPRRYLEFFLMNRARKDKDGKINIEFPDKLNPKSRLSLQALPTLEQQAIHNLYEQGLLQYEK